eukprot:CAMPEP_0184515920 /NCGR_PEP_ID=MMETSP0198_2-20121128/4752_1 /TAXON_ID=1112570 /ORGANISM="Thraustochytrium sp., Strain LLF1b" /LENGTH=619 /DNA_ID=CAMNT_0026906205 /DNA_START=114 /DNA_END=1973 /DNA_ORIENTATION=+
MPSKSAKRSNDKQPVTCRPPILPSPSRAQSSGPNSPCSNKNSKSMDHTNNEKEGCSEASDLCGITGTVPVDETAAREKIQRAYFKGACPEHSICEPQSSERHSVGNAGYSSHSQVVSKTQPLLNTSSTNNTQSKTPIKGAWKAKRALTLQTNIGLGHDEARSPTSSAGPVSPVSVTSAASAPAVFRQVPVRAKAEMIGHVASTQKFHQSHQQFLPNQMANAQQLQPQQPQQFSPLVQNSHAQHNQQHTTPHSESVDGQGGLPFSNANRAMECWVTSPSTHLDRTKKKDAFSSRMKTQLSPRIRSSRSATSALGRASSIESIHTAVSQHKRIGPSSGSNGSKPARQAPSSPISLSSQHSQLKQEGESEFQGRVIRQRASGFGSAGIRGRTAHQRLHSPTAGFEHKYIARRLSLLSSSSQLQPEPNESHTVSSSELPATMLDDSNYNVHQKATTASSVASTPASSVYADAESASTSELAVQVSKVVTALDALSSIPIRMEEMERKMMSALESMDKRITDLDFKLKSSTSNLSQVANEGQPSRHPSSGVSLMPPVSEHNSLRDTTIEDNKGSGSHHHASVPKADGAPQHVPPKGSDGIADFLKTIEDRFRESETVLAESETQ